MQLLLILQRENSSVVPYTSLYNVHFPNPIFGSLLLNTKVALKSRKRKRKKTYTTNKKKKKKRKFTTPTKCDQKVGNVA